MVRSAGSPRTPGVAGGPSLPAALRQQPIQIKAAGPAQTARAHAAAKTRSGTCLGECVGLGWVGWGVCAGDFTARDTGRPGLPRPSRGSARFLSHNFHFCMQGEAALPRARAGKARGARPLHSCPHLNSRPLGSSDRARLSGRPQPAWVRKLSREGDSGSRLSKESSAGGRQGRVSQGQTGRSYFPCRQKEGGKGGLAANRDTS